MQKPVIGVSMPLAPQPLGTLGQQRSFFAPQGLGRQANPAIRASLLRAQAPATGAPASSGPMIGAGFERVLLMVQGTLQVQDAQHPRPLECPAGSVLWQGLGHGQQTEIRPAPALHAGAPVEALELWINLPACYKHIEPHRQWLEAGQIPALPLPDGAGTLRLIAGEHAGQTGPAETVTPLHVWDVEIRAGHRVLLPLPCGWHAQVFVLRGRLRHDLWPSPIGAPQLLALDRAGDAFCVAAEHDGRLVVLCCEPLAEPVISHDGLVFASDASLQAARQRLGG